MILNLIIVCALVGLGILLVIPAIRLLESRPLLSLCPLVLIFVATSFYNNGQPISYEWGGININIIDLIGPLLLCLTFPFFFARLRDGCGRHDVLLLLLLLWSGILGLNYILGLRVFGLQGATNEFRGYFYIICIALYVASLDIARVWLKLEKLVLFAAFCLSIVAIVGFVEGGFSREDRPIGSSLALLILQALLIAIFMHQRGQLRLWLIPLVVALLPLVIVLQHRSVWIVAIIALALVLWLLPSLRTALIQWGVIGTVVCGGLCALVFGSTLLEALTESYADAAASALDPSGADGGGTTFSWRVQGWTALLTGEQMDSARERLVGNPFGTGYDRIMLTGDGVKQLRSESPHNFYVQTMLRGGALGLLAFLALHGMLLSGLLRRAKRDVASRPFLLCMAVLVASQLVYYLVYGSDYIQAIFLGSAIGWLRHSETRHANK